MPPRRSAFTFDQRTGRFRSPAGRFLSAAEVRAALERRIADATTRARTLGTAYREGRVSLAAWEIGVRAELKTLHTMSALAAKGGRSQMTNAEQLAVARTLKAQYRFLRRFADELAAGAPFDGREMRRLDLYVRAARATYQDTRRRDMEARGFTEARSVLHPGEHCQQCIDEAAKGYRDPAEIVPIGARTCLHNCKCSLELRNPQTGQVAA